MTPNLTQAITDLEQADSALQTAYGVETAKNDVVVAITAKLETANGELIVAEQSVVDNAVNFNSKIDAVIAELGKAKVDTGAPSPVN